MILLPRSVTGGGKGQSLRAGPKKLTPAETSANMLHYA